MPATGIRVGEEHPNAVPIGLTTAGLALDQAVHDGGLTLASQRACEESAEFLMRVRPTARFGIVKRVRVQVLPARTVNGVLTVLFRWEATGPTRTVVPVLVTVGA